MNFIMIIKRIALFMLISAIPQIATAYPAIVSHITDGDTLDVLAYGNTETPITLRLYGIDAPEKNQPGGAESAAYLREMLPKGSAIEVLERRADKYGRAIAIVYSQGHCVNTAMLRAGHAWYYPRFCHGRLCTQWGHIQDDAARDGVGLWKEPQPIPPWEWRKR